MSDFFFVGHELRNFEDLFPELNIWKRFDAQGAWFSWLGFSICWRKENPIFVLNEAIKELRIERRRSKGETKCKQG